MTSAARRSRSSTGASMRKASFRRRTIWLDRVYAEGNKKVAVLRNEYTDELEERVVDQVVIENGITPNVELYTIAEGPLAQSRAGGSQIAVCSRAATRAPGSDGRRRFLLFRVGDCVSMHNIHAAIYDSLRLCKDF